MTDEVKARVEGRLGLITLDRPKALNAINEPMVEAVHAALDSFAADNRVGVVVIEGAGERAFCAGGDVVRIVEDGKAGSTAYEGFFAKEYRMNAAIARYRKPYIALMDGITMGGGVGLSAHGRYRVATERTLWAMPETGIGMMTDVGGTHALSRLPGRTGMFLGLTGARLDGAEARRVGVATHFVPSDGLEALKGALAAGEEPEKALADAHREPGSARIDVNRDLIDTLFGGESVEQILAALDSDGSDWATKEAQTLRRMSPSALKIVFEGIRRAAGMEIEEALAMEYRVVCRLKSTSDFYEGVRALLIDKDKAPRWSPRTVEEVTPALVASHFEPPPWGDLRF